MDNTKLVNAITKAIGYTENGGKPNINSPKAGKSGETKSIFQFIPATWKRYAKEYLGDENAPMNADTETFVVQKKVAKDLKSGKSIKQIASEWNAGDNEPDAYSGKFSNGQASTGKNKEGVNFNVPEYANKVEDYTKQFLLDSHTKDASATQQPKPLQNILSLIQTASKTGATPTPPQSNGLVNMPTA